MVYKVFANCRYHENEYYGCNVIDKNTIEFNNRADVSELDEKIANLICNGNQHNSNFTLHFNELNAREKILEDNSICAGTTRIARSRAVERFEL